MLDFDSCVVKTLAGTATDVSSGQCPTFMPCGLTPSAPEPHICCLFPSPLDFHRLPSSNHFAIHSSITFGANEVKKTPGPLHNLLFSDNQPNNPHH